MKLEDKEKEFVREYILAVPEIREAIRKNDFYQAFRLCRKIKPKDLGRYTYRPAAIFDEGKPIAPQTLLADSLYLAGIDIFPYMEIVPERLFYGSVISDAHITIPNNIQIIEKEAFNDMGTQITFGSGPYALGTQAFGEVDEVYLPREAKGWEFCGRAIFQSVYHIYCYFTKEDLKKSMKVYDYHNRRIVNTGRGKYEYLPLVYHLINQWGASEIINRDTGELIYGPKDFEEYH